MAGPSWKVGIITMATIIMTITTMAIIMTMTTITTIMAMICIMAMARRAFPFRA